MFISSCTSPQNTITKVQCCMTETTWGSEHCWGSESSKLNMAGKKQSRAKRAMFRAWQEEARGSKIEEGLHCMCTVHALYNYHNTLITVIMWYRYRQSGEGTVASKGYGWLPTSVTFYMPKLLLVMKPWRLIQVFYLYVTQTLVFLVYIRRDR